MSKQRRRRPPPATAAACCSPLPSLLSPRLFKALADPNRLSLLVQLAEAGEAQTVSEVATCCSVDLSVVSRHLAILRDAGILACEKRGKEVHCSLRTGPLVALLRQLANALEACCPADTPVGRCRPSRRGGRRRALIPASQLLTPIQE